MDEPIAYRMYFFDGDAGDWELAPGDHGAFEVGIVLVDAWQD